jgi:iron complex transport system substrate-binding protein
MRFKTTIYSILPFFLVIFLSSCGSGGSFNFSESTKGEKEISVRHAQGLRIWQSAEGFRVVVRNPQDTTQILGNYFFKTVDQSAEDSLGKGLSIRVPITNAALQSTTFVSFFDKLGEIDRVDGLGYAVRNQNANMAARLKSGAAIEITSGNDLDFEQLLKLAPDVLMVYQYADSDFSRYTEEGIPVVMNMEFAESTPLGRAEWIKLVGCLTGKLKESVEIFDGIEKRYRDLRTQVAFKSSLPLVFTGSKYGSSWFAPGRDSFIAQYIRDAGGIYSFEHIEGQGSTELDFEGVVSIITQADYWGFLISSEDEFSYQQVLEMDGIYSELKAFKRGQIFVCNTAKVDYFGDAVMEPDRILADLIGVFHPDLTPDHVFHYFRPITK